MYSDQVLTRGKGNAFRLEQMWPDANMRESYLPHMVWPGETWKQQSCFYACRKVNELTFWSRDLCSQESSTTAATGASHSHDGGRRTYTGNHAFPSAQLGLGLTTSLFLGSGRPNGSFSSPKGLEHPLPLQKKKKKNTPPHPATKCLTWLGLELPGSTLAFPLPFSD